MNMDISIRPATEADSDPIATLTGELGYPCQPAATRRRVISMLGRSDYLLLVAEAPGSAICGWLQAHSSEALESGFRAEIVGLVVAQNARRQGIGQRLVAEAEKWASSISAPAVVVRTNSTRSESHPFYLALGYTAAKTQVVYRKAIPFPASG
jgi:GNAT superfamily N-acetyltransferase